MSWNIRIYSVLSLVELFQNAFLNKKLEKNFFKFDSFYFSNKIKFLTIKNAKSLKPISKFKIIKNKFKYNDSDTLKFI